MNRPQHPQGHGWKFTLLALFFILVFIAGGVSTLGDGAYFPRF